MWIAGALALTLGAVFVGVGLADPNSGPNVSDVATPNQKASGYAPASKLSPELQQLTWAQGSTKLENPDGTISFYGYENDGPMVPTPRDQDEAQKTEPDKNTYLVFKKGLSGPDASY